MRLAIISGALGFAFFLSTPALADKDDKRFVLQNHTNGSIREFAIRTRTWSNNWLAAPVRAGAIQNLRFNAAGPSSCVMTTRVVINHGTAPGVNERVFEQNINYCGLSRIHVNDRGLSTEGASGGAQPARPATPRSAAPPSRPRMALASGQRVLARFAGSAEFYPATITRVQGATVHLYYADGDTSTAPASHVRPFDWRIGTRVRCLFGQDRGGTSYPGRIAQMTPAGALQIHYDDGDVEWTTTGWCHTR